jgi:hypothetical protein
MSSKCKSDVDHNISNQVLFKKLQCDGVEEKSIDKEGLASSTINVESEVSLAKFQTAS